MFVLLRFVRSFPPFSSSPFLFLPSNPLSSTFRFKKSHLKGQRLLLSMRWAIYLLVCPPTPLKMVAGSIHIRMDLGVFLCENYVCNARDFYLIMRFIFFSEILHIFFTYIQSILLSSSLLKKSSLHHFWKSARFQQIEQIY